MCGSVRTDATADDLPRGSHGHDSDLRGRPHGLEAALESGGSDGAKARGRQRRGQVFGSCRQSASCIYGSRSARQMANSQNAPVRCNGSGLEAPVRISSGESHFK